MGAKKNHANHAASKSSENAIAMNDPRNPSAAKARAVREKAVDIVRSLRSLLRPLEYRIATRTARANPLGSRLDKGACGAGLAILTA
jgi:hypothetical protein